MLTFLTKEEAQKLGYSQKLGLDILIENQNLILNPGNWYWVDETLAVKARCYYEDRNLG